MAKPPPTSRTKKPGPSGTGKPFTKGKPGSKKSFGKKPFGKPDARSDARADTRKPGQSRAGGSKAPRTASAAEDGGPRKPSRRDARRPGRGLTPEGASAKQPVAAPAAASGAGESPKPRPPKRTKGPPKKGTHRSSKRAVAEVAASRKASAPKAETATHVSGEPQRIAKLLARAGVASRREIERMIADGRIAVDGVTLDTPATLLTSLAGVVVDGKPVAPPEPARLWAFHKPTGLITAERDPTRRTITDHLQAIAPDLPRLMPIGRLDLNTEGLLLMTNDGELKRQMELPATGVERTYRARTYGDISQAQLEELIHGITIEGVRYGKIDANLERRTGRNQWVEMTLTEGKNREVRRVLEHLGLEVSRLLRVRYGPFELGDLEKGAIAPIQKNALERFRRTLS